MMKVVPRLEVLLFTRKTFINERGRSQEYVWKDLQECADINCCISWPLVSYSINFFSCEIPANTEEYPDDPEPADGDINRLLFWLVVQTKYRCSNKILPVTVRYCLMNNLEYFIVYLVSGHLWVGSRSFQYFGSSNLSAKLLSPPPSL
jgi:hypothetical protein